MMLSEPNSLMLFIFIRIKNLTNSIPKYSTLLWVWASRPQMNSVVIFSCLRGVVP